MLENGVRLYFASGIPIQEEYGYIGKKVRKAFGLQHSKTVRVGHWWLTGSCNWSTSSRCNLEVDTLTELHNERTARDLEKTLFQHAVRQEREHIIGYITKLNENEAEKIERRSEERRSASASGGRTISDVLRAAPLADVYTNSRGGFTLDYRNSPSRETRSRSHGR